MSDATPLGEDRFAGLWDWLTESDVRWYQLLFYGFLLVWMVALLVVAWEWTWRDKLVPYIAGVPTIVLLVAKILKIAVPSVYDSVVPDFEFGEGGGGETSDLQESLSEIREEDTAGRPRRERIAYAVRMLAWSMALPLLMYTIGFANALVLFVFAFGVRFYDDVREAVLITVLFSAFMYLFFYEIMGLQPWKGILELPSIVSLLGLG